MYINQNNLNEGKGKNGIPHPNSKEFCEGKNPREHAPSIQDSVWPKKEHHNRLNHSWEGFRK